MNKRKNIIIMLSIAVLAVIFTIVTVNIDLSNNDAKTSAKTFVDNEKLLSVQNETKRITTLKKDIKRITNGTYDGLFLSMMDGKDWNMDIFREYDNKTILKAKGDINSYEEFMNAWNAAEMTSNQLTYSIFIINPYELLYSTVDEEGNESKNLHTDLEEIFVNHPDSAFTVLMAPCSTAYWKGLSLEERAEAIDAYETLMTTLSAYPNIILGCFSGYDWYVDNSSLFNENGGLTEEASSITYEFVNSEDYRMTPEKIEEQIELMKGYLLDPSFAKEREISKYKDYDIIFLGDSIFELNDGPFSISSYFSSMTGARIYNLSKSGMTATKNPENDLPSLPEFVNHIFEGKGIDRDKYDVFNREVIRFAEDNHEGKKLLVISDFGINDYAYSMEAAGNDENSYEGALKECISKFKERYADVEYVNISAYHFLLYHNGNDTNALGFTYSDYKNEMKRISEEEGLTYIDLEAITDITEENAGDYLLDGLHPGNKACYEISKSLLEQLEKME